MSTGRRIRTLLVVVLVLAPIAAGCGGEEAGPPQGSVPPVTPPRETTAPPGTSEPPTTAPGQAAVDEAVAEATAGVVEGQITHNVPESMTEGDTYAVVIRVGSQATVEEFKDAVEAAGGQLSPDEEANTEGLPRVGLKMRIRLSFPPSAFAVTYENSEEQDLPVDGVARWGYQLRPSEPGEHEIRITAEIVAGDSVESLEPVYDGTVDVAVADRSLFEDLRIRSEGFVQFLLLIFAAASALGGVVALREYRARNRAPAESKQGRAADDEATRPAAVSTPPPPPAADDVDLEPPP